MLIKKLKGNTYDVFLDKGWKHWVRVVRHPHGVRRIAGGFIAKDTLHYLNTLL